MDDCSSTHTHTHAIYQGIYGSHMQVSSSSSFEVCYSIQMQRDIHVCIQGISRDVSFSSFFLFLCLSLSRQSICCTVNLMKLVAVNSIEPAHTHIQSNGESIDEVRTRNERETEKTKKKKKKADGKRKLSKVESILP